MPTTIYALCEPDLQVPVIRYIGKTSNLAQRVRGHRSTSSKKNTHLGCWLRSLMARGEKPVLLNLCEVSDDIGAAAEILYIRLAREGGMDLVNATDGGDGISHPSVEVREKIGATHRGKTVSTETRIKLRAAQRGKVFSSEARKKIGEANRNRNRSREFSKKISSSLKEAWVLRKLPFFTDGSGI